MYLHKSEHNDMVSKAKQTEKYQSQSENQKNAGKQLISIKQVKGVMCKIW